MAGGTVMLRDRTGLDWLGSPPLLWFKEEGSQQGKGQEGREWQRGQQGNGQAHPRWPRLPSPLPSSLRYHPTSTSPSPFLCQHKSGLWQVKESESEESCSVVSDSLQPHGLYNPWNSPGQNTGVGSLSLLQGIFPTQGWNPGLPHCRWIFLPPELQGKSKNTGVAAYPFSSESFQPRNRTRVSYIAGRFFTNWAIGDAQDKDEDWTQ